MKRYCVICGDDRHNMIKCPEGRINADLSVGEWIHVYLMRRFGQIGEAAAHYRVSSPALSMALRGSRPLPVQLFKDAGISVSVKVEGVSS